MTKPVIIADSGPLIALSIIDRLELLPALYHRVVVPTAVWDEVTVHGRGLPGADAVSRLTWPEVMAPDPRTLKPLSILVDPGEAEAIALALDLPDSTVLLDDSRARRVAERFGIQRIGTVGLLRKAKRAGLVPIIRPLIEELQNNGIYLRRELIEAVLRDVGE
jgi:hypothetical protein